MPHYLGFDPGLGTAGVSVVSIITDPQVSIDITHCGTIHTDAKTSLGRRLIKIRDTLYDLIKKYDVKGISCEGPSFLSKSSHYSLGAVHGMVVTLAAETYLPIIKVAPQSLKKFAAKGGASKETVKQALSERWRLKFPRNVKLDAVDASGLGIIGALYFEEVLTEVRAEMEVVADVVPYDNFNSAKKRKKKLR